MNKKSYEELKQIAKDMVAGKIFTDRQIPKTTPLHLVFMPFVFMEEKQRTKLTDQIEKKEIYMIYEYLEKAGPRAINGMPTFMSCNMLSKTETDIMLDYFKKIKKALDEI